MFSEFEQNIGNSFGSNLGNNLGENVGSSVESQFLEFGSPDIYRYFSSFKETVHVKELYIFWSMKFELSH